MENLSLQLEQLLEDFVVDFLNKMVESEAYQASLSLPSSFRTQYRHYLSRFSRLTSQVENHPVTNQEEAQLKNRILALLQSSSRSIISTFHLED